MATLTSHYILELVNLKYDPFILILVDLALTHRYGFDFAYPVDQEVTCDELQGNVFVVQE